MFDTAARSSGLPAATSSGSDRVESRVNSPDGAMCCSHIPASSTRCRRNASWWLVTAVSTARMSSGPTLGSSRRISGTRQRPVSRNPRSRKYAKFGGTAGCACASGGFANPPAANEASTTAVSAAKVGCSYRSCGVRLRPSLAALIAMAIAIRESPPRAKKLAFGSTELTPKHCDQMRCNVASVCDCPWRATSTVEESVPKPAGAPTGKPLLSAGTCAAQTVCLGSTQCRWRANA